MLYSQEVVWYKLLKGMKNPHTWDCIIKLNVLDTYKEITDLSYNLNVLESESSSLRHFCRMHKMRGLKPEESSTEHITNGVTN